MMKTKKSTKSLALVLAAVLALTPMAGFPITALATGEAAAPQTEAPSTDATDALQAEAPAIDADANTDAAPGTAPGTPAPDAETPQVEAPATETGTNPDTAGSATRSPAANVVTPDLTPTPTADPAAATGVAIDATNFPGEKFRAYVQDKLDPNKDGSLDTDEIKAVTKLDLYGKSMMTLQGIEYFTALTELNCVGNYLRALDVSKNTALTFLSCSINYLRALDVSKNTALTFLDCGYTNLTTLDVSKNTALTGLYCSSSSIGTLDLSANTALTTLDCSAGGPTTLDLSANIALTTLYARNSALTTLDVSNNAALETLICEGSGLTTLDLTGLDKLSGDPAHTAISPQDPRIPVVKRGESAYELDLEALTKGKAITAITLNGEILVPKDYEKMRDTAPTSLQYTCETGSSVAGAQTMEVTANGFDLYHPATLVTDANGTLTCDVAPSASGEILLAENSTPTFTATSASGYQIATLKVGKKDITVDKDATSQTLTLPPVTDAVTIAATFKKLPTVDITASVEGYGTIDPEGIVEVIKGTDKTFTITPNTGSELASVLVDGTDVTSELKGNTYTFTNVTAPHTIAATFKKIPPTPIVNFYSVTATAENGTITSDHAAPVREGSSVKCTFSPKEGYTLESVSVNGELVKATEEGTTTAKTYSYTINSIYTTTTIHVIFKAIEPPVDPTDPVDPPKPPVDPTDPVDPPKPPVDPADPINPPTPPALPDNGGNGNNNGGGTTIVERINTVVVPVAPQAAALAAAPAAKTEAAPAQVAADNAAPQGQLENPTLGSQTLDTQHSHIPLALLLLAVWLVGGFAVIRQRKHAHDAIEGAGY